MGRGREGSTFRKTFTGKFVSSWRRTVAQFKGGSCTRSKKPRLLCVSHDTVELQGSGVFFLLLKCKQVVVFVAAISDRRLARVAWWRELFTEESSIVGSSPTLWRSRGLTLRFFWNIFHDKKRYFPSIYIKKKFSFFIAGQFFFFKKKLLIIGLKLFRLNSKSAWNS